MARQVLTYPDIPPVLTQAAADTRYALAAHNHDAVYSPLAHTHTGVYSPLAHTHTGTYLPLTGGTMTGPGTIIVVPGFNGAFQTKLNAADTQPTLNITQYGSLSWGAGGSSAPDVYLTRDASGGILSVTGSLRPPVAAPTYDLGATDRRWKKVWGESADLVGTLTVTPPVGSVALLAVGANGVGDTTEQLWVRKTTLPRVVPWHQARSVIRIDQRGAVFGDVGGDGIRIASNVYFDPTGAWKRIQTGANASMLSLSAATMIFNIAPDGPDDGVLTWKQPLHINSNGAMSLVPDDGVVGLKLGNAPLLTNWAPSTQAIHIGAVSTLYDIQGYSQWGNNNYNITGADRAITTGAGSKMYQQAGALVFVNAVSVTGGTNQAMVERFRIDAAGNQYNPGSITAGSYAVLSAGGGVASLGGWPGGYLLLGGGSGSVISVAPAAHNAHHLGWGDRGWVLVHSVSGLVQDSIYDAKQDFAPLDPALCATAVLETDWVSFAYKTPAEVAPKEGASEEVRAGAIRHAAAMQEAAVLRRQKGYVLQSPEHKVHDLFGMEDRKSASAQTDLAVVACALQHCLLEIAELKARLA